MTPRLMPRTWAMLIALSVLWGGSFLFVAVAVERFAPFTVVLARVALAAPVLWAAAWVTGNLPPLTRALLVAWAGMALLNNVIPMSMIALAQRSIPSGLAGILNAATPILGVLVAHWLTPDERITPLKAAGVLTGFAGVAILAGPDALASGADLAGVLLMLGACLSYAFSGVWGRRFRALGVPPLAAAAGQVTASTLILLPLVLGLDRPWEGPAPPGAVLLALLGLGLLSTALAYALFFRILDEAGATNVLLVTLLIPVTAVLLGVLVLDEAFLPRHALGMAAIALALALIDGRAFRGARAA